MTLEKKLNELIGEGINITKQAQEDGASYSTDPDNYLDNAYKIFNDWRQEIKDFIYNEKIGSDINVFFFYNTLLFCHILYYLLFQQGDKLHQK